MPLATRDSILCRYRKKHGRTKKKAMPAGQVNTVKQTTLLNPVPAKANWYGTAASNATPKTGISRINEIMRSTPDLDELARLAKEKTKKREREQKEIEK